jgi:hypothetical protein
MTSRSEPERERKTMPGSRPESSSNGAENRDNDAAGLGPSAPTRRRFLLTTGSADLWRSTRGSALVYFAVLIHG